MITKFKGSQIRDHSITSQALGSIDANVLTAGSLLSSKVKSSTTPTDGQILVYRPSLIGGWRWEDIIGYTMHVDAPILGNGSSGDHLRLDSTVTTQGNAISISDLDSRLGTLEGYNLDSRITTAQGRADDAYSLADAGNAKQIQGRDISSSAPSDLQVLAWNNTASQWEPKDQSGGITSVAVDGITITGDGVGTPLALDSTLKSTYDGYATGKEDAGVASGLVGAHELTYDHALIATALQSVSVDGTTITGDGTSGNPLVSTGIPVSAFGAKGDLLVGAGAGTYVNVGVGASGAIPMPDSTATSGIAWFLPLFDDVEGAWIFDTSGALVSA